jgi:GTP cyclohydrolase I
MKVLAIRFTDDIYRDIEKGSSKYFNGGNNLGGLCAWSLNGVDSNNTEEEIEEAAARLAQMTSKNTYGGYSSSSEYAIIEGTYARSGNDGIILTDVKLISRHSL